jgi:hypothetical protein
VNCGPGHIPCRYSCAYSDFSIQLKLPALLFEICRHLHARYTANLVPYIAHTLQFTLCELWYRTYTMELQLRIFRLQYSSERIGAAIGDIWTIKCALNCTICAKTVRMIQFTLCELWSRPYNTFTAPHIQCFNIQLNVSALQLQISRQLNACYTTNLVTNTAHSLQFSLSGLWSRTYTM